VNELPSITGTNSMELQENMVFTIRQGIDDPGVAGVRIEVDLVVTKDGGQVLTEFPKTLQVIE
ncbi:M24 family metallopeptidase, partial [Listeria monocytogenes]|uniref:M24 family metallopeptidase n=1 Tax=Listeria monocytogenes TaxID=1639 RepID=UPI0014092258